MLVLTRRQGQKIILDDNIVISVVSIRHDQVRIGVDAPKHVNIVRDELQHKEPTDGKSAA